jgi:FkbM family methyltransferase
MIIEIGTSDFRTKAGQVDGVFIEPVKYYYDRMKAFAQNTVGLIAFDERPTTHFENVAISDYEGEGVVYSASQWVLDQLPQYSWMRGCNSFGKPHPSLWEVFARHEIPVNGYGEGQGIAYNQDTVKVVRIKSIIDKYNITSLDLLKIDTEGHDCIILNDYLNTVEVLPKVIQFESNELSDPKEVAKVCERLKPLGYDCKQVKYDMICQLH